MSFLPSREPLPPLLDPLLLFPQGSRGQRRGVGDSGKGLASGDRRPSIHFLAQSPMGESRCPLCASVSSFVPNNSIYFLGTEVTAQVRGPVFGSGHARGKGLRNARAQLLPGSAARPLPGPPATPLLVGHVPITRPPEVGDTHTTIPHSRL